MSDQTILIDPVLYWKLRTAMATHQLIVDRCNKQVSDSQQALNAQMVACGLDPAQRYRLSDDDCSAGSEPVVSPKGEL